ncbi:MAG: hypothetical protein Q8M34_09400 [Thermodesulfovibrionales bacterium]|nr:hypothetical protein [Thermodesulfovibrionales bacterium]
MENIPDSQQTTNEPTEDKLKENKLLRNLRRDGLSTANCIQIVIALVLIFNLCYLNRQIKLTQEQIKLTQVLNQPLCAVKEIKVNEVKDHTNRIKIYAVITNSGNYTAKNASIEWEFYQCNDLIGHKQPCEKIKGWHSDSRNKMDITILPKQEFNYFLIDVPKERLNKRVEGYDRSLRIKLTIKYNDMDEKSQQYLGSFLIIRVGAQNLYETTIEKSSIEPYYSPQEQSILLDPTLPRDASPNVTAVPSIPMWQGK